MPSIKKVLSIAGSDCSGGAGIQADLKTFAAHGVFGMSVITSVVAENTVHMSGYQDINPDIIAKQIDDVFSDITPDAVKIGMLSCSDIMKVVFDRLKSWRPINIVVDPVMYCKNGSRLMSKDAINTLISVITPMADILTPNIPEAEEISGTKICCSEDMKKAAACIKKICGCRTVVVKGGHCKYEEERNQATDLFYDGSKFLEFTDDRIDTRNTHGTGCTFSSAIASNLALEYSTTDSIRKAKYYISNAIANDLEIGKGHGPVNHFYDMYDSYFENRFGGNINNFL